MMRRSRGQLLLVDDDLSVRRLLAEALRLEGYDVDVAGDVDEGWQAIETRRPDVVILDVMMPGGDGLHLLRRVRGTAELRDLTVVLLSARAQPEDLRRGQQAGADLYVTKPFTIEQLVWHLDEAMHSPVERPVDPLERFRNNGPLSMDALMDRVASAPARMAMSVGR